MNSRPSHYQRLEIPTNATLEEIRIAFKRLALKYHPDKNPDNQAETTVVFRHLLAAYIVLSHPRRKQIYDSQLGIHSRKPAGAASTKNTPKTAAAPRPTDGPIYDARPPPDIFSPFPRKCTCDKW